MDIVALSTLTGREAVRMATGVEPITYPPHRFGDDDFRYLLERVDPPDVLYVHLHGMPDQPYWYGDGFQTAISDAQIAKCNLNKTIAFVANCYGQDSHMVEALLKAGAQAVVAGPGTNYTIVRKVRGADLLGKHFIDALKVGRTVAEAYAMAKSKLKFRAIFSPIERDALGFTLSQGA